MSERVPNPEWEERWNAYSDARRKVIFVCLQEALTWYETKVEEGEGAEQQEAAREAVWDALDEAVMDCHRTMLVLATTEAYIDE